MWSLCPWQHPCTTILVRLWPLLTRSALKRNARLSSKNVAGLPKSGTNWRVVRSWNQVMERAKKFPTRSKVNGILKSRSKIRTAVNPRKCGSKTLTLRRWTGCTECLCSNCKRITSPKGSSQWWRQLTPDVDQIKEPLRMETCSSLKKRRTDLRTDRELSGSTTRQRTSHLLPDTSRSGTTLATTRSTGCTRIITLRGIVRSKTGAIVPIFSLMNSRMRLNLILCCDNRHAHFNKLTL